MTVMERINQLWNDIEDPGVFADGLALPLWIILLVYSVYELRQGNSRAWLVLSIISCAFVVDSALVFDHYQKKKKFW